MGRPIVIPVSMVALVCLLCGACDKSAPTSPAAPASAKKSPPSPTAKKSAAPTKAPRKRAAVAQHGPRWACAQPVINFGAVWEGETVERTFEFRNIGDRVLKIKKPKPHCSCSSSNNYTPEVPPGGTGYIPFVYRTTNKPFGSSSEYLTIETNDPNTPETQIWLRGHIRKVCEMEVIYDSLYEKRKALGLEKEEMNRKAKASFGRIDAGDDLHRVVRLVNTSGKPLELRPMPDSKPGRFTANLQETEAGEVFELTVKGTPPFRAGHNSGIFKFSTNVPEKPELKIQAYAYVPPRVEVVPIRMVVNRDNPKNHPRRIKIRNNGKTPFGITSLATTDSRYRLELISPNPDEPNGHLILVHLPGPTYRPPPYGEIIRIGTSDAEKPVIDMWVVQDFKKRPTERPADRPLEFHPVPLPE